MKPMVYIKGTIHMIDGSTEARYWGPLLRSEAEEKIQAANRNPLGLPTYPVDGSNETGNRSYEIVEELPAGETTNKYPN